MRVVVIGGGLGGLFTASELVAGGVDEVVVVDEGDPGGVTRTVERDGFSLEPAVGSFNLPHPHLSPILERAGTAPIPAIGGSVRHVYVDGRLVTLPSSPRTLLAPVASISARLRALLEPLVRSGPADTDETLAGFCRRRFGDGAGELLAWLMASGVFAGDPERLSAGSAFPMLVALEQQSGSVMRGALRQRRARSSELPRPRAHVPSGGMSRLVDEIAGSLGQRFRRGFEVESVRREPTGWVVEGPEAITADVVVVALRPERVAALVGGEMAGHLRRARSAPVAVVGLGDEGPSPLPPGFGALVGPGEEMATLGVLFESSYAPTRAPDGSWLVKVIVGGATNPGVVEWEDDRLVSTVIAETSRVIGAEIEPDFVEVVRHRPGIPQYETGHRRWLEELEAERAKMAGLYLAGWGYRGVGAASLATDAARLAREILG